MILKRLIGAIFSLRCLSSCIRNNDSCSSNIINDNSNGSNNDNSNNTNNDSSDLKFDAKESDLPRNETSPTSKAGLRNRQKMLFCNSLILSVQVALKYLLGLKIPHFVRSIFFNRTNQADLIKKFG